MLTLTEHQTHLKFWIQAFFDVHLLIDGIKRIILESLNVPLKFNKWQKVVHVDRS